MAGGATGILVAATLVTLAAACSGGSHKAGRPPATSPSASTPGAPGSGGAASNAAPPSSTSPGTSAPAATVDACKLVTQQEASALFGHPAVPWSTAGATGAPATCAWRAVWAGGGGTVEYLLHVYASLKGATQSINVVQNSQNNASGTGTLSVTNDNDTVQTAKDGKSVALAYSVSARNVPDPPRASSRHAQLNELARNALDRM